MQKTFSSQVTGQVCGSCNSTFHTAIPKRAQCLSCKCLSKAEVATLMNYDGPHVVHRRGKDLFKVT